MGELLDMLAIEDLTGNARDLAEVIGLDGFKRLVKAYGGTSNLYIPKADMLVIPVRDTLIRREYDGSNVQKLALKWGLTDRYVQEIVKEEAQKLRFQPVEGQVGFSELFSMK